MISSRIAFAALLVVLTGCNLRGGDPNICGQTGSYMKAVIKHDQDIKNVDPDRKLELDNDLLSLCVREGAYRLAGAPDRAETIATSVADSCDVPMMAVIIDVATHSPSYAEVERSTKADAYKLALYDVLAARSGHCTVKDD